MRWPGALLGSGGGERAPSLPSEPVHKDNVASCDAGGSMRTNTWSSPKETLFVAFFVDILSACSVGFSVDFSAGVAFPLRIAFAFAFGGL